MTRQAAAGPPVVESADLAALVARVESLLAGRERVLLGLAGPPGAGKSTLARGLLSAVGPPSVVVPFDGFHLAQPVLADRGLADVKGAIETFDLDGFRALMQRLRSRTDPVVYAPTYRREIEEAVANAVPVSREVRLVITEGNYLLRPEARLTGLLDETWFLEPVDDDVRRDRLIQRHVRFGKTPEVAREWVLRSDERNAALVAPDRARADLVVMVP